MSLPWLDAAEVRRRLPVREAVEALREALLGGLDPDAQPPRTVLPLDAGELLVMPSAAAARPVVKLVTVGGEPRIQGLCIAFDGETLAAAALLDGPAVTDLRTSALSALAVDMLAVPEARRLLVLGRGPQARAHVEAVQAVRPIEHVEVLGRADAGRIPDAVAVADVICCCTTARAPLFDGALVGEHAVVVAIGSHQPDAREVDDTLAARATVVVESVPTGLREAGDVVLAVEHGVLEAGELVPLAALVRGAGAAAPGRPRLFKSTGMPWEDAVVVDAVLRARPHA